MCVYIHEENNEKYQLSLFRRLCSIHTRADDGVLVDYSYRTPFQRKAVKYSVLQSTVYTPTKTHFVRVDNGNNGLPISVLAVVDHVQRMPSAKGSGKIAARNNIVAVCSLPQTSRTDGRFTFTAALFYASLARRAT